MNDIDIISPQPFSASQPPEREHKSALLMTGLMFLLVVIIGFQAIQLNQFTKVLKNGGVVAGAPAAGSVLDSLKTQVGGCGD